MPLLATGAAAINTAIKAVAIARQYIERDELELMCQPAFRDRHKLVELTVSKASKPQTVAGAIAARAREGISTTVTGIGPDAVSNACVAVCHSRIYLEDDKLDVRAVPFFEEVEKDSGDGATHRMTAVKLRILVETVS